MKRIVTICQPHESPWTVWKENKVNKKKSKDLPHMNYKNSLAEDCPPFPFLLIGNVFVFSLLFFVISFVFVFVLIY